MRFLVLSGGASKGAFQIGVLKHLVNDLNTSYHGYCGVSVGALNCSFMSQFGDEQEAFNNLFNFWINLDPEHVYKSWCPFGRLSGLYKDSLYNSAPLVKLVKENLDLNKVRSSGKKVSVGAVSLTTGQYRLFTQDDDCFVDAVLASSSFPAAFRPIDIDGEEYTDGGVKHITPLKAAIQLGATEVDVIVCSPENTTTKYDKHSSALSVGLRSLDLMSDQITKADLQIAEMYNVLSLNKLSNKKFIKINVIRPETNLTEDSLNFSHNEIVRMMNIGYDTAMAKYKNVK